MLTMYIYSKCYTFNNTIKIVLLQINILQVYIMFHVCLDILFCDVITNVEKSLKKTKELRFF